MTTPTPGDLSARLLACAKDCDVYSPDQCATLIDGIGWISMRELLTEAAAALSALPAAGGAPYGNWPEPMIEVAEKYLTDKGVPVYRLGGSFNWHEFFDTIARVGNLTTPQPSAADDASGVLLCAEHGPMYAKGCAACAHDIDTMPGPDAAVGAQGEGFRAALEQIAAETSANNATEAADRFQRIARDALAAPAAGKGVDADKFMAAFNCEAENTTGTRIYCADRQNVVTALEAALTRQPVAGDGIRNGYRHVVHELLTNIKRAAIRGRCGKLDDSNFIATCDHVENLADEALSYSAPAATPTDGGEGES